MSCFLAADKGEGMHVRLLTATVLATAASQAHAQQLDAALNKTLTSDPQIAGADALVGAAEAGVEIDRSARLPQVFLDANAQHQIGGTQYNPRRADMINASVRFDLALYTGGELTGRIGSSVAALDAERARRDELVNMRLPSTAARYASVYRDERIEATRLSQVANVEALLTATRARQRGGASTTTDTHQAAARLAIAQAQLTEARALLTRSNEELRESTGTYFRVTNDPEPPVVPARVIAELPEQLNKVPTIRFADALVSMARADLRVARSERAPKLYLSSLAQTGDDFSQSVANPSGFRSRMRIGFSLRLPLFGGGAFGARIRHAQQRLAMRQEYRRAAERQVVAQIRGQYAQLMALDAALPALNRALAASRAALFGVQIEFKIGARSSLDVLNAQEELAQAEILLAQVRQRRLSMAYAILGMLGEFMPEGRARLPVAKAVPPIRTVAASLPAAKFDKLGLWVWKGSQTWSLKPGNSATQIV